MTDYQTFLESKRATAQSTGIEVALNAIHPTLFPFQHTLVQWALRKGRAALFCDCGMGKTFMQIEWARIVHEQSGGDVLILAPLAVAGQTTIQGREVTTRDEWIMLLSPRHTSAFIQDDGAWRKVRRITPTEDTEVWDIQVAEDASFTAEGCIVHNCPLQLDVIERALELWTNPGETVLSPFCGIGSEGFVSLQQNRKFIGIELKESYVQVARKNLEQMEREKTQATLWEVSA